MVFAVGRHSQWGRIRMNLVGGEDEATPLQEKLELMATRIGYVGMVSSFRVLFSSWTWSTSASPWLLGCYIRTDTGASLSLSWIIPSIIKQVFAVGIFIAMICYTLTGTGPHGKSGTITDGIVEAFIIAITIGKTSCFDLRFPLVNGMCISSF